MFEKVKLLDMPDIYTANAFNFDGGLCIGLGPEKAGNPCLITYPSKNITEAGIAPGGMMSLIPVPDRTDMLVSVMGLFPPFQGKDAGVYRHTRAANSWKVERVLHLPFAHRCEILQKNNINYLFVSTVSRNKQVPTDWSEPGEVFFSVLADPSRPVWEAEKVMGDIFRNHGMLKTSIDGKEVICISGAEGIFSLYPDDHDGEVKVIRLFDKEVSEFTFVDLDGDGLDELVTIEPFHGNSLNVYKQSPAGWEKKYDASLSFGHGLSSGILAGIPVIAVGNRSGEASLDLFGSAGKVLSDFRRICVEKETGTTQTQIFCYRGRDYILSANQLKGEAALYFLKENSSFII